MVNKGEQCDKVFTVGRAGKEKGFEGKAWERKRGRVFRD